MKIGILTFHRAINYGAVLQMYGLYHTLQTLGAEVDIIDYRPEFNEKRFEKKAFLDLLRPRELYGILFRNSYQTYRRESFLPFIKKMTFSDPISDKKELEEYCNRYDRIVVGSDQVWNLGCTVGDDSYLLPFPIATSKKASYAASIAYQEIPKKYKFVYEKYLSDFKYLSVRERNSIDLVRRLIDKECYCHMDPSMLMNATEWELLADYSLVPETPYMLLYLMSEDHMLISRARKSAQEKGLQIIYINNRLFKMRNAKNLSYITPEQWLGLFLRASYVCVNSFHGLAFAINFNKPFLVKLIPRSIANSRLLSILEEYDLSCCLSEDFQGNDIDYIQVNKKLNANREYAIDYLHKLIS